MTTTQADPEALKPILRDIGQGPTQGRNRAWTRSLDTPAART